MDFTLRCLKTGASDDLSDDRPPISMDKGDKGGSESSEIGSWNKHRVWPRVAAWRKRERDLAVNATSDRSKSKGNAHFSLANVATVLYDSITI